MTGGVAQLVIAILAIDFVVLVIVLITTRIVLFVVV